MDKYTAVSFSHFIKKLECIMEVWQHLIKVIIIYWNAEEVTLLYKWRLLTCGCDIQNIGYAINLYNILGHSIPL